MNDEHGSKRASKSVHTQSAEVGRTARQLAEIDRLLNRNERRRLEHRDAVRRHTERRGTDIYSSEGTIVAVERRVMVGKVYCDICFAATAQRESVREQSDSERALIAADAILNSDDPLLALLALGQDGATLLRMVAVGYELPIEPLREQAKRLDWRSMRWPRLRKAIEARVRAAYGVANSLAEQAESTEFCALAPEAALGTEGQRAAIAELDSGERLLALRSFEQERGYAANDRDRRDLENLRERVHRRAEKLSRTIPK